MWTASNNRSVRNAGPLPRSAELVRQCTETILLKPAEQHLDIRVKLVAVCRRPMHRRRLVMSSPGVPIQPRLCRRPAGQCRPFQLGESNDGQQFAAAQCTGGDCS